MLRCILTSAFVVCMAVALPVPGSADSTATLAPGDVAADFGLRRVDPDSGKLARTHWLSDYVGPTATARKQVVVLSFYATWCKPCVAELPELSALQQQLAPRGVQFLGINVRAEGEGADAALSASHRLIREHKLDFPLLVDRYTKRTTLLYVGEQATLPCHVVLDGSGTIVTRLQGRKATIAALSAAIEPLLQPRAEVQTSEESP